MIFVGLLFGIVALTSIPGMSRFSFGFSGLTDGLSFVVVAMGLFGFAEILRNLESAQESTTRELITTWSSISIRRGQT